MVSLFRKLARCLLLPVFGVVLTTASPGQGLNVESLESATITGPSIFLKAEEMTRLQVLLGRENLGPGKIDGRWGEFTGNALRRFQKLKGLAETGTPDEDLPLDFSIPIFTKYVIRAEDANFIGEIPQDKTLQAKLKLMPYPGYADFLAERFHSDPKYIIQINADKKLDQLKAGDSVKVPNVKPFEIENVPVKSSVKYHAALRNRRVLVDTAQKMLDVFEGDSLIASFPITPGSEKLPAPKGTWKIESITTLPYFRWDEKMLKQGERSDDYYLIPPGPRNPVGAVWMQLNRKGIGLHGTNSPYTIGRSASHGCIRLANWDALTLSTMITSGAEVVIQ